MRALARTLLIASVTTVSLFLPATRADAHALLQSSDPADGQQLDEPPKTLTLTFTEEPEPSLSVIQVLDQAGAEAATGPVEPVPDAPGRLFVRIPSLSEGVYTVTWRVVSRVDGHPTGGAFVFGVGVSPAAAAKPAGVELPTSPPSSPVEIAGRWVLFVGLGLLLGAGWIGSLAFPDPPVGVRRLAVLAWTCALVGLIILAAAQRAQAGVGFVALAETSIGRALVWRSAGVALAGVGAVVALTASRWRRPALAVTGLAAAATMLVHVAAGHAAASPEAAWTRVAAQWAHFAAVGVWLGGLAALLVGLRGRPGDRRASAVRRFSAAAGVAIVVVAVSGVTRSLNEVGSWEALFSTAYGRLILIKAGLLIVLGTLGAVNRYRNVPGVAAGRLRGLRRVSRAELTVAAVALVAAAGLATVAPPSLAPAAADRPAALEAAGSDFAGSVRARLEVDPGLPGPNRFRLRLSDYDTADAIDADRVTLRFAFGGQADVQPSTLELEASDDGVYAASGSNLSIGGVWELTALVQQGTDSVEVPLELATVCTAQTIEAPDQPTIHTVEQQGVGSVEGYLIPLGRDRYEVHFTFLGPTGRELAVQGDPVVAAWRPGSSPVDLDALALSRGHFLADAQLEPGEWRFDGAASGGGRSLSGCFEETLGG